MRHPGDTDSHLSGVALLIPFHSASWLLLHWYFSCVHLLPKFGSLSLRSLAEGTVTSSICIILTYRSPSLVSSVKKNSVKKNFPGYLVRHHTSVRLPSPAHPDKCYICSGKGTYHLKTVLECFSLFIREIKVQTRLGSQIQVPSESPVEPEFSEPPNFPLVWVQSLARKLFIPICQGSVHHLSWFVLYPRVSSLPSGCTLGQQTKSHTFLRSPTIPDAVSDTKQMFYKCDYPEKQHVQTDPSQEPS